ncbi:glycosyltransferase family 4 protein [Psychrobacter immobilis]|uniref:glycosyltransferase family 4 protein n=1 Tax=Psychrobacter immobilis TaxID=498 RepID=UPI001919F086|nr:glycosyltransferase family 4 protein [Psychrobacter immobilis]
MKILHINTHDTQGGAARAAYRLHRALLAESIDSKMLVKKKSSDDYTVLAPTSKLEKGINLFRPALDSLPVKKYKNRTQTLFSPAWLPFSQIPKKIAQLNPDIVHLHWINSGMMSVKDLAKIDKPIVWSLHDMWAFTGGEHYDEHQQHYLDKCGNSQVLSSKKANDLSRKGWERKQKVYEKIEDMTIVGLSNWMHQAAKSSSLLKDKHHIHLPNPINTAAFAPFDKIEARRLLNLPKDKKLILFGAINATSDPRKGFNYIFKALRDSSLEDAELVIFGTNQPATPLNFTQHVHYLGHLHDNISLRVLYNAADVMIVPSLQESFGQTAVESLACGTPVVAFNTTGLKDIIDHKINGYLAKPFDTNDLANGIEWVLNAPNYRQLCDNARDKVLTHFDSQLVAKQYIALYKEILAK